MLFLIPKNPIYGGLLVVFPLYVVVIAQIAAFACGAKGCRFEFCQGHRRLTAEEHLRCLLSLQSCKLGDFPLAIPRHLVYDDISLILN